MYSSQIRGAIISCALAAGILALASAPVMGATRQISSSGTTTMQASAPGADGLQFPEIPPGLESDEGTAVGGNAGSFNRSRPGRKLGVLPHKNLETPVVVTSAVAGSNPEVALGFQALNHRDQRLADGGNQFSIEPPDQGLCVGNGYIVEAINSVLQVWSTGGVALTGVPPEPVLRIRLRDRSYDGGFGAGRDRRDLPLRPGQQPVRGRANHSVPHRHDQGDSTEELDRRRGEQHGGPDGRVDDLSRSGAERRHRRHAKPPLPGRRRGIAWSVLPGLPAHRRRPLRRLHHDQRVLAVRPRLQRSAGFRILEELNWPRTRRRST